MLKGNLIIGRSRMLLEATVSTNKQLMEMCSNDFIQEGFVLRALNQLNGKGQFENIWVSAPEKNILMSVLLKPDFLKPSHMFRLNIAVALAVHDTLNIYFPNQSKIKWSNDILLNHKKVCGILIENQITFEKISKSIVGIGLNVMQDEFPENLKQATSFYLESGRNYILDDIAETLIRSLDNRYIDLKKGLYKIQFEEYIQLLYGMNEEKQYITNEGEMLGIIRGVDEHGQLLVEIEGEIKVFRNGEIKLVYT